MSDYDEQKRVERLIALRDSMHERQANFRQLWQDTADWQAPMFGRIVTDVVAGERFGEKLYDITAIESSKKMASGLSSEIIPAGQEFFDLQSSDRQVRDDSEVEEYLAQLTEDVHEILYASNFISEFNAGIFSLIMFGITCTYPKFGRDGLMFRTYPIGTYYVRESADGRIDTKIVTVERTAQQLYQRYGDNIGKHVRDALMSNDPSRLSEPFKVIHIVQPRKTYNKGLLFGTLNNRNMAYESVHVCEVDKNVLEEGGFREFPYAIPRWHKSPGEVYGRGQGTEILPQVRKLNQMEADKTQAGNRWVEPPLEILESFDGIVNLSPKALNYVLEPNTIRAIDLGAKGSYPIAREEMEQQRDIVKSAFFHNAFAPLTDLTGDRRNEMEIRGRLSEAYKQLTQPLTRLFNEYCNPLIERSVMLLVRAGVVAPPPPQLRNVKIIYTGPLALALRDQHVVAFDQWWTMIERMEALVPGTVDNVDVDESSRDIGRFLGVKESHIRSVGLRDRMRKARLEYQKQQMKLQNAQVMSQAYGQMTGAPEQGSAAEAMGNAV